MVSSFPFSRSFSGPFSRPLSRPSAFDPDAGAYIDAIVAAGATVSDTQRTAIGDFYTSAKADGYYTSLKRLYLPIWGVAAANAIDMIGLTSGTFVGSVTHSAGYVQSNGTTGYFNAGTAAAAGISVGSCSIFTLARDATSNYSGVYGNPPFPGLQVGYTGVNSIGVATSDTLKITAASTGGGVLLVSQTSATARSLYQRLTAGFSTLGSNTTNDSSVIPNIGMFFAGAINAQGSPGAFNTVRFGAYGMGTGLTAGNTTNFTLALQNLWVTCTGLIFA